MEVDLGSSSGDSAQKEKEQKEKQEKFDAIYATKRKKDTQDFTDLIDKKIPEFRELASKGNFSDAVEGLFGLEKTTRNGEDINSTKKVAVAVVQVSFEYYTKEKNIDRLIDNLNYLAKRRGQFKQVTQAAVQETMTYINELSIPDLDTRVKLIETLRSITEGKIYVENERARLTKQLAGIREAQGNIAEAAEVLQEIQVETFGSMEPKEKIEFILEQVRLMLAKNDFTRAQILSRKITNKALNAKPELEPLKIEYYKLMVKFYNHNSDYLNITRSYRYIYDTKIVQDDRRLRAEYLKLLAVYIVLAPYGNEQSDLIHRINEDRYLIELPQYREFLRFFITQELISWPKFQAQYQKELDELTVFGGAGGAQLWKDMHSRVVEHNIRVVAMYYQLIDMKRFSQLLDLGIPETEKFVSDLVSSGSVWAKIDRPKGIVSFRKRQDPNDLLNNWSHDVGDLLGLLEKTCHLIYRETMVNEKK